MVTVEEFSDYVGQNYETSDRQADLTNSLAAASAHLEVKAAQAFREIPTTVYDFMVKEVARNLYTRSQNNNGQYASTESLTPANDPLAPIKAVLKDYVLSV